MNIFAAEIPGNRKPLPTGGVAGSVIVQKSTYAFPVAAAVGDIIDLAVLPALNTIVAARLILTGAAVGSVEDVCILSGKPGDIKSPRQLMENVVQPPGEGITTKYTASALAVRSGGENYQVGTQFEFFGGVGEVTSVGDDGVVTGVSLVSAEQIDTDPAGQGVATETAGAGEGLTIDVTSTSASVPAPPAYGDGMATDSALLLPFSELDRSIGVELGAAVAANGGTMTLVLEYAA